MTSFGVITQYSIETTDTDCFLFKSNESQFCREYWALKVFQIRKWPKQNVIWKVTFFDPCFEFSSQFFYNCSHSGLGHCIASVSALFFGTLSAALGLGLRYFLRYDDVKSEATTTVHAELQANLWRGRLWKKVKHFIMLN